MKSDPDLRRLVDSPEASSEMRALLVAGATDEIDYDFERGLGQHLTAIGTVAPASVTAAAGKGALLSAKAWLALAGGSVAAITASAALLLGHGGAGRAPESAALPATARVPAAGVTLPSEPLPSPRVDVAGSLAGALPPASPRSAGPSGLRARSVDPTAPTPLTLAETEESDDLPARKASPAGASQAGAPSAVAPSRAAELAEREHDVQAREEEARKARAEAQKDAENDQLSVEMAQLLQAKRALATDPALTLSLATSGQRDFPHSMFGEEREHLRILALLGLGRTEEAKRRAAPYLASHPDNPFARRVQSALDAAAASR